MQKGCFTCEKWGWVSWWDTRSGGKGFRISRFHDFTIKLSRISRTFFGLQLKQKEILPLEYRGDKLGKYRMYFFEALQESHAVSAQTPEVPIFFHQAVCLTGWSWNWPINSRNGDAHGCALWGNPFREPVGALSVVGLVELVCLFVGNCWVGFGLVLVRGSVCFLSRVIQLELMGWVGWARPISFGLAWPIWPQRWVLGFVLVGWLCSVLIGWAGLAWAVWMLRVVWLVLPVIPWCRCGDGMVLAFVFWSCWCWWAWSLTPDALLWQPEAPIS